MFARKKPVDKSVLNQYLWEGDPWVIIALQHFECGMLPLVDSVLRIEVKIFMKVEMVNCPP